MAALSTQSPLTAMAKPPTFSGAAGDWKGWSFSLSNYVAVIDGTSADLMATAERQADLVTQLLFYTYCTLCRF